MFIVGALLSILQAVGVVLMPASPRFFVLRGKYAEVSLYTAIQSVERRYSLRRRVLTLTYRIRNLSIHI